jgi:hypothetical protein
VRTCTAAAAAEESSAYAVQQAQAAGSDAPGACRSQIFVHAQVGCLWRGRAPIASKRGMDDASLAQVRMRCSVKAWAGCAERAWLLLTQCMTCSSSSCYQSSHSINAIDPVPHWSGRKREHCSRCLQVLQCMTCSCSLSLTNPHVLSVVGQAAHSTVLHCNAS